MVFQVKNKDIVTLKYFRYKQETVPMKPGIYSWYYWPNFKNSELTFDTYWLKLINYCSKSIGAISSFSDYKFSIDVKEANLQSKIGDEFPFGLSEAKSKKLKEYLAIELNRIHFSDFLYDVVMNKPFYVGKADNLRVRLNSHLLGGSDILKCLEENRIDEEEVLIKYEVVKSEIDTNVNDIYEEIFQKIVKPSLVKKPG